MKWKNRYIIIASLLILSLIGCNKKDKGSSDNYDNEQDVQEQLQEDTQDGSEMFTLRDMDIGYDEEQSIKMVLNNETVTITEEGVYILSGTIEDGQIIVDAGKNDKIQLVLNGVDMNNNTSAAIYVKKANKVFITLATASVNTLSVSGEYVAIDDNNIDAVIFSKSDLTLNGNGKLTINGVYGNGITSKDNLVITSGDYFITSAGHGLEANDSVRIADGSFNITSGKDGIQADNSDDEALGFVYIENGEFIISAEGDGIDGSGTVEIIDGELDITTSGGSQNATTNQKEEINFNQEKRRGGFAMPEGQEPPEGERPEMPEGQEPPEGEKPEMPEGLEPSEGERPEMPEGQEPPEGEKPEMPEGLEPSEGEEIETSETQEVIVEEDTTSKKGIKSAGNMTIVNGTFNIDSVDDSIHSDGNIKIDGGVFTISSGDDGIHGDGTVIINNGNINILTSYEGIEGNAVEIHGGDIQLVASDDGLNAAGGTDQSGFEGWTRKANFATDDNCYIIIAGGKIVIDASGDGIDSNGNFTVTGGETYISGPTNSGDGAIDYDGTAKITGGIILAVGEAGMEQNFGTESTQGSILVNTKSSKSSTDTIILQDSTGTELLSYTPTKRYSSVVISTPEIQKGGSYTLIIGSENQEITMTDIIYGSSQGGFGGMGGRK
mgnify:CR=1 FL=1